MSRLDLGDVLRCNKTAEDGLTSRLRAITQLSFTLMPTQVHSRLRPNVTQPASGQNAEAALQRRLAKKLGLKSRRTALGGDDGLDDILDGLDDLESADGGSDESESDRVPDDGMTSDSGGEGVSESDDDQEEGSGGELDGASDRDGSSLESSGGDSELGLDSDGDEPVRSAAATANAHPAMNGRTAPAAQDDADEASDDTEETAELDSDDGASDDDRLDFGDADDDGSMEVASAERRQSHAVTTASGRTAAGALGVEAYVCCVRRPLAVDSELESPAAVNLPVVPSDAVPRSNAMLLPMASSCSQVRMCRRRCAQRRTRRPQPTRTGWRGACAGC